MQNKVNQKRLGHITKELLRYIATGAVISVALSSPVGAGKLSNLIWKESKKTLSGYLKRRLHEMEKAGYIKTQGGTVKLSAAGKKLLARTRIESIVVEKEHWDHKWRCVAYDIPNTQSKAREAFRQTLLRWGFVQIQKSVFVLPFQCSEQVAIAARFYHVDRYVLMMEANDIPTTKKLKNYFSLS